MYLRKDSKRLEHLTCRFLLNPTGSGILVDFVLLLFEYFFFNLRCSKKSWSLFAWRPCCTFELLRANLDVRAVIRSVIPSDFLTTAIWFTHGFGSSIGIRALTWTNRSSSCLTSFCNAMSNFLQGISLFDISWLTWSFDSPKFPNKYASELSNCHH